jgi:amino acid transporter
MSSPSFGRYRDPTGLNEPDVDAVSTGSEESRRVGRNLPLAIIGSLAIATVIKIAVAVVATAAHRTGPAVPRAGRRSGGS